MSWFEHRHYWRHTASVQLLANDKTNVAGIMHMEDCACGAVRQIEYRTSQKPVVLVTEPEKKQ